MGTLEKNSFMGDVMYGFGFRASDLRLPSMFDSTLARSYFGTCED